MNCPTCGTKQTTGGCSCPISVEENPPDGNIASNLMGWICPACGCGCSPYSLSCERCIPVPKGTIEISGGSVQSQVGKKASILFACFLLLLTFPLVAQVQSVDGPAAHDSPVARDPIICGFRANDNEPSAVSADGDAVWPWGDRLGRSVVVLNHPTPSSAQDVTLSLGTETALQSAPGAGQSLYVTTLMASNTSSTAVRLDVKDGSDVEISFMLAADGGGYILNLSGNPWKLTANTALNVQLSSAVTDVRVTAFTYTAP